MRRYLLDTNVVILVVMGQTEECSASVKGVLEDYNNLLYVSTNSLVELIHLHRSGKIDRGKRRKFNYADEMLKAIENIFHIVIKPFGREHTYTYFLRHKISILSQSRIGIDRK